MIFDRTKSHAEDSQKIRDQKVKKGIALTEEDIYILERGMVTVDTLNRIEEKQDELKKLLNDMGYWNTPISNKVWNPSMVFNSGDLKRIFENSKVLRNAFFVLAETPSNPRASYEYNHWNSLEKILYDIETMVGTVKSNYKKCGKIRCGGVI